MFVEREVKMKIIAREHSGFCYGVKRAVAMAEESIGKASEIHTLWIRLFITSNGTATF